jgi:hypothetical protein
MLVELQGRLETILFAADEKGLTIAGLKVYGQRAL